MSDMTRLPVGPRPPERVYAVIEIPRGGRAKYEYDPKLEAFRLDRILYSSVHYPTAYGFIPGTLGADGDPEDILVCVSEPAFTGAVLEARPVGALLMTDEKGEDGKIVAVSAHDPHYQDVERLEDLPAHLPKEIEHFFQVYKQLEGKPVKTLGWNGQAYAFDRIRASMARFAPRP